MVAFEVEVRRRDGVVESLERRARCEPTTGVALNRFVRRGGAPRAGGRPREAGLYESAAKDYRRPPRRPCEAGARTEEAES